jgi:2-isopropylmalate synthase
VVFGKAWDLHAAEILRVSLEENLEMIADTVAYLKGRGKEVIFDAEHFFDGYAANPAYAVEVLRSAQAAGADVLCLCDTNGGQTPDKVFAATKAVCGEFAGAVVGIHAHNDSDCAVANSLMAVLAGAAHVQGTFVGFGERCGNADLSSILPALRLKMGYDCGGDLSKLSETAARVAEIANVILRSSKPYTGRSAFSHKAGMHVDGVLKNPASFEHIDPARVGAARRFLVSEVAGRGSVLEKIRPFAPELTKDSPALSEIVARLKELEHFGYQFEAADASFELLVRKVLGTYTPHFNMVMYKTIGEFPAPDGALRATATIKVEVDGRAEIAAAQGCGPVNALDVALRKALAVFYPQLGDMHLTDYKVRVLEQAAATAAKVRVLVESADAGGSWTTLGVSEDVVAASLIALADSIEYKLSK